MPPHLSGSCNLVFFFFSGAGLGRENQCFFSFLSFLREKDKQVLFSRHRQAWDSKRVPDVLFSYCNYKYFQICSTGGLTGMTLLFDLVRGYWMPPFARLVTSRFGIED